MRRLRSVAAGLRTELDVNDERSDPRPTDFYRPDVRARNVLSPPPVYMFERQKTGHASATCTWLDASGAVPSSVARLLEALLSRPETIGDMRIAADDRDAVKAASIRSLIEEKDLDITFRVPNDDATIQWLRVQAPAQRTNGTVRWTGVCTDVTELAEARDAAERACAAKELELVNVSHELRAPLQAIVGFADLLATETSLERVAANAKSIKIATASVLALVNQLLGVAEADAAEETVRALAEACLALVGPQAVEKGLSTTLDVAPDVPDMVVLDGQKLRQALLNLMNNAVKFTDVGTVALRIDRSSSGLRFSVIDTGIGIKVEERSRLFQRFSRIDAEPSGRQGTGLGLSITKGLVESMGGTIDVADNAGGGTTFWFEVPLDVPTPPQSGLDTPGDAETIVGSRVLLADDLDLNRKLIADMLSIEGHRVDCVADGAAAVAAASANAYDLILMDMIMPGMDGIAATRAIRAMPAPTGNVPIVALTANSLPEQLDSCLDAGMDATLTKPMSIDALMRAVAQWTGRRSVAA